MITKNTKQVLVVMERYNPQLGCYCTIRKGEVKKVLKASAIVSDGFTDRKYDLEGYEKSSNEALYGSTTHHVYTYERAKELFDGDKFNRTRISSGIEILQAL